jgi:hypothetical protein
MVGMDDLVWVGPAAAKLLELCHDIMRPGLTRKQADAQAYAINTVTEAQIESAEKRQRAMARLFAQEERRQENLEAVVAEAREQLPPHVEAAPVDPDWFQDFVSHAQDVSDADMRMLWARILAGEVAQPGSFSRRALDAVRVLARREAEMFQRFCRVVVAWRVHEGGASSRSGLYINVHGGEEVWELAGIDQRQVLDLRVIGLIADEGTLARQGARYTGPVSAEARYGGRRWTCILDNPQHIGEVGGIWLTPVGLELLPIIAVEPMHLYADLLPDALNESGFRVVEDAPLTPDAPTAPKT